MKIIKLITGMLAGILLAFPVSAADLQQLPETKTYEAQSEIDTALLAEAHNGYTFKEPAVILNPYGTSPLTAVAVFQTEEAMGGTVCVKGKEEQNDIYGSFAAETEHIVPIYGLYSDATTEVELTLDDGTKTTVEVTTERIPLTLDSVEVTMIDDTHYDYSNLTMVNAVTGAMYALDAAGDVRWFYEDGSPMGVHVLENGRLFLPNNYMVKSAYYKESMMEMDLLGKVYHEYAIPGGVHHDFQELANGNFIVASGADDFSSVEDHVYEIDRQTGEVVWELALSDLLGINDGTSVSALRTGYKEADWFHNNAIYYDEASDLLLLSGRNKDAIVAVNKTEKTLAWILGDPEGWEEADASYFFTPTGENFEWQYAQHEVTMLNNKDIMLFDNGSNKVKANHMDDYVRGDDIYSRAVVYRINTDDMTISQVFQYGKERGPQWYSDFMSGVESLDGTADLLWITSGTNLYDPENDSYDQNPMAAYVPANIKTSYFDLVVDGELACEIKVSGTSTTGVTYRSVRMPLYTKPDAYDVNAVGEKKGSLRSGIKAAEQIETANAEVLETIDAWEMILDEAKLAVSGSYATDHAAEELEDDYLILVNESISQAFPVIRNTAPGEEQLNVVDNAWVSRAFAAGETFEVFLKLDGIVYRTGYQVTL